MESGAVDTFRPTVGRRPNHVCLTGTLASVSNLSWRVAVGAARVWIARIVSNYRLNGQWLLSTRSERISNVSTLASASWDVVDHPAEGVGATEARARINTVKLLTGLV